MAVPMADGEGGHGKVSQSSQFDREVERRYLGRQMFTARSTGQRDDRYSICQQRRRAAGASSGATKLKMLMLAEGDALFAFTTIAAKA